VGFTTRELLQMIENFLSIDNYLTLPMTTNN